MSAIAADVIPRPSRWVSFVAPILVMTMGILMLRSSFVEVDEGGGEEAAVGCDTPNISAGASVATVNTAITNAADGATLCFAAGTYTWNSSINFPTSKGITLMCEMQGDCIENGSGIHGMNGNCASNAKLLRLAGFTFTNPEDGQFWFWNNTTPCTLSKLRIDHNTFSNIGARTVIFFGEGSDDGSYMYGSIDNNTFAGSGSFYCFQIRNSLNVAVAPPAGTRGSANNMYFEDNVVTVTTMNNTGIGCIDGWGGHSVVVRFNTFTNTRALMHGVTHSWGPINFEVYGNKFIHNAGSQLDDCYRSIHHQGSGMYLAADNEFDCNSTISDDAIVYLHYRSWTTGSGEARCDGTVGVDGNRSPTGTYYGYPCYRQPGRDIDGTHHPIYAWKNRTAGGALVSMVCNDQGESNPNTCVHHVKANRDAFTAVSASAQSNATTPFNGTVGVGYGTLANRPTTCTANTEAADAGYGGVGYWATDQGSWNSSSSNPYGVQQNGADGVLYSCTSTNTWSVEYTPLDYPHPLRLL